MLKSTIKRYFTTFLSKKRKKTTFNGYYLVQGRVIIWTKLGVQKEANLEQIITIKICSAFSNPVETPIFIVFGQTVLKNKLGPDNNY